MIVLLTILLQNLEVWSDYATMPYHPSNLAHPVSTISTQLSNQKNLVTFSSNSSLILEIEYRNLTTTDFPIVNFQSAANDIKMKLPMPGFTCLGPEFEHPRVELLDYHLICPEHIRHNWKTWKRQVFAEHENP